MWPWLTEPTDQQLFAWQSIAYESMEYRNTKPMETFTYTLPTHWAPALINDDWTGLDEHDEEALMRLMANEALPSPVDVLDEPGFMTYHDARPYGVLACDCSTYTFIES